MSLSKWYSKKRLMTIILGSIIVLYHTPTGRIKAHSIISCKVCGATFWSMRPIPLKHHVMCYKVLCNILPIKQGTPGRTPSINACVTQHTGPTASRPIRRTNIWFGVLLKVTPLDTVKHVWRYSVNYLSNCAGTNVTHHNTRDQRIHVPSEGRINGWCLA